MFQNNKYYKHKNCMDAFIRVNTVTHDNGETAFIWADWMIQGIELHWHSPVFNKRLFILADQYENWLPYQPKGEIY